MIAQNKILFTGGSGLLGSEFRRLLPGVYYPASGDFDVTDYAAMESYIAGKQITTIVHAAAFTSPPRIDQDPVRALDVNIIGTANIVKLCARSGMKLVYISTDYVFRGDVGNYGEDDPVFPVNKYAWSKLGGECAVRLYDNSLIIRTTFGPNVFPFEKAFIDQWTSRESVKVIAGMIAAILVEDITGTIHVGGYRKTVFAYAKGLDPEREIGELSVKDVSFKVPVDTSLDCSRFLALVKESSLADI